MTDPDRPTPPDQPATPPDADQPQDSAQPPAAKPARKRRRKRGGRRQEGIDYAAIGHQVRILAMQSLFEFDQTDHDLDDILARLERPAPAIDPVTGAPTGPDGDEEDDTEAIPPDVARRAIRLVRGVIEHLETIDPHIAEAAPAFPLTQLAAIDRCVLRLAVYELTERQDEVPYKVAINEAVEIAKRFGGDNSGRFVNGVLGTIARKVVPAAS